MCFYSRNCIPLFFAMQYPNPPNKSLEHRRYFSPSAILSCQGFNYTATDTGCGTFWPCAARFLVAERWIMKNCLASYNKCVLISCQLYYSSTHLSFFLLLRRLLVGFKELALLQQTISDTLTSPLPAMAPTPVSKAPHYPQALPWI